MIRSASDRRPPRTSPQTSIQLGNENIDTLANGHVHVHPDDIRLDGQFPSTSIDEHCEPDPGGCRVEFEDPEFTKLGHDVLYYVRAIQEPTPTVNGGNLRCRRGDCEPCYGNYRTSTSDDCLTDAEERGDGGPTEIISTVDTDGDAAAYTARLAVEEGADGELIRTCAEGAARAAAEAGVQIVAGDTKVVPRGKGDRIYAVTAGLGVVPSGRKIDDRRIIAGDVVVGVGADGAGVAVLDDVVGGARG